ncbi:unnamed protein product [Hyaloperonospora brassicae]|uniref:Uncharacterized protein n=1 Tax=Hyaloperonospora brassicae TaxID=162125 RepID=A0AAV0SWD0_HYABA|nr:unnamed protein product [Hyaloperonospora brassicae]
MVVRADNRKKRNYDKRLLMTYKMGLERIQNGEDIAGVTDRIHHEDLPRTLRSYISRVGGLSDDTGEVEDDADTAHVAVEDADRSADRDARRDAERFTEMMQATQRVPLFAMPSVALQVTLKMLRLVPLIVMVMLMYQSKLVIKVAPIVTLLMMSKISSKLRRTDAWMDNESSDQGDDSRDPAHHVEDVVEEYVERMPGRTMKLMVKVMLVAILLVMS